MTPRSIKNQDWTAYALNAYETTAGVCRRAWHPGPGGELNRKQFKQRAKKKGKK